jgi:hypothetical protein
VPHTLGAPALRRKCNRPWPCNVTSTATSSFVNSSAHEHHETHCHRKHAGRSHAVTARAKKAQGAQTTLQGNARTSDDDIIAKQRTYHPPLLLADVQRALLGHGQGLSSLQGHPDIPRLPCRHHCHNYVPATLAHWYDTEGAFCDYARMRVPARMLQGRSSVLWNAVANGGNVAGSGPA